MHGARCQSDSAHLRRRRTGRSSIREADTLKLVINFKTAKATGIELSQNLMVFADEVIE